MKILYGFLILAFVVACESENEQDLFPPPPPLEKVTFAGRIQPLIKTRCTDKGCHATPQGTGGFLLLNTYAEIKVQADNGKLREEVIISKRMPKNGPSLPPNDIDDLKTWLDEGALNN